MTGEVTLRGRVLAIGGLREKTMAALRSHLSTVIIPAENEKDLEDIDPTVRASLKFVFVKQVDEVLVHALLMGSDSVSAENLPAISWLWNTQHSIRDTQLRQ